MAKIPSRSNTSVRLTGRVVPNRSTNDVLVDGVWYNNQAYQPSVTPSVTPTVTPTMTITPSITPSISVTPSLTPTPTPTPSV